MARKVVSPTEHFAADIEAVLSWNTEGMRRVTLQHLVSQAYFLGTEHGSHNMALAHGVDLDELIARYSKPEAA